jgi:hypothetical protein
MNEPRRLVDGHEPGAELLSAARAYRPPPTARRHVLRMLGLPVGLSLGATFSAALASTSAKVLLVAAVTATAGVGIAYRPAVSRSPVATQPRRLETRSVRPPATVSDSPPTETRVAKTRLPAPRRPAIVRLGKPARRRAAAVRVQPTIVAPSDPPPTASPLPAPPGLAAELALLEAADGAIRKRRFREALAWVQEHQRAFPDSALAEEAAVLRISALLGTNQRAAARAEAERFFTRSSGSLLSDRVRSILTGDLDAANSSKESKGDHP